MHRYIGILIFVIMSSATAAAQSFEVFGGVGYGRTFRIGDDSPGDGVFWSFGAGFRPLPRIRLEGAIDNLDVISHPGDHVANILYPRASVIYEFSGAPIRPFVLGGAGAARIREIQTITFPTRVEIREDTETSFAFNFGAGVGFQVQPRVAIRPLFVVITPIASRSNVNVLQASVQIAFSW